MRGRIHHQLQPARMGSCEARAYCAGLIDGDGCLSIARQLKPDARRGYIFRLTLDITQNHLGTLLDFQNLLQLQGRVYQVKRDPSQNRDSYVLNFTGKQALAVIQAVQPYLMRKHQEANVAIEFMTQCHIHRHFGPSGCPDHVWRHRERLYRKMKNLK